MHVPFLDLNIQLPLVSEEIEARFKDIIGNAAFILGNYVNDFEQEFAKAQGARYCLAVSSGTDALHLALLTLGIGPGDAVVLPANTFFATAEAVSLTGATPVFVDHDGTYHLDPEQLKKAIQGILDNDSCLHPLPSDLKNQTHESSRLSPRAIIPVHLYGQPADMDRIMNVAAEFGLTVIEDCAQSHLATWQGIKTGNFGSFGAFSFYPSKNLGAWGEAGALVTNDEDLFNKAQCIRQHGQTQRYVHRYVGHNYRMENFQGAVLGVKLKHLQRWTEQRRANAALYDQLLAGIDEIIPPKINDKAWSVYHLYVIQTEQRDEIQLFLKSKGVSTGLHYPIPLHLQEAYQGLGYVIGDFPYTEESCRRILSLPMYPELSQEQIHYVCECLRSFFRI